MVSNKGRLSVAAALAMLSFLLMSSATGFSVSSTTFSSSRTETQLQASSPSSMERRSFLVSAATAMVPMLNVDSAMAATDSKSMIADLEATRAKLDPLPGMIQKEEWDQVRTILKTPPVNFLWNMGDSKNPIQMLAIATDELDLIEAKDDIAISLQMCDQLVYDNVFLPFQPGNGKIKIKEPTDLAIQAMKQIDDALKVAKEAAGQ